MSELLTPEVRDLTRVLAALDDEETIFALLEDLFTIREIKETSQRLAVARMLDSGRSYAAIEDATGASATTIARVSKCLGYGSGGYRAALDVLYRIDAEEAAASEEGGETAAAGGEGEAAAGKEAPEDSGAPGCAG